MKAQDLTINTVRVLSAEAIEMANSGHPGTPLGAAPLAVKLWADHMVHNPSNPTFMGRDRFVLSAGHASALLYSLLHVFGYGIAKEELMSFRQLNSRTPGHPEYGHTVGVETTTGPLGQGFANAVGMAAAEKLLGGRFNREKASIIDHYTYVLCGDGCMQEGVQYEAASLAGTWELNKLICFYDCNKITIEGSLDIAFTENVADRYRAMGWDVLTVADGNNTEAIGAAISLAKASAKKPTLIIINSVIGYGSSKEGSAESHGAPLGKAAIEELRRRLEYKEKPFETPKDVTEYINSLKPRFMEYEENYKRMVRVYKREYPELYEEYLLWNKKLDIKDAEALFEGGGKDDATRNIGGAVLNKLAELIPNLVGGSADLSPSTKTYLKGLGDFSAATPEGKNLHFGIREFAMAAICNGMYLHGGLNVFCSTFFVFSDYMKNAIRMSAIMGIPVTYILTHDSIGVGEDGPTHQPVEQLIALRSIPGVKVFRPCNYTETVAAYLSAFRGMQPTAIVLSRQNLKHYDTAAQDAAKGGYVLYETPESAADIILIASGSEVSLAMDSKDVLEERGFAVRVVSMPCIELFEAQTAKYRETVLPASVRARVAIEAGSSYSWHKYVGLDGYVVGMDSFGASAPAEKLFEIYGFSVDNVVNRSLNIIKKNRKLFNE